MVVLRLYFIIDNQLLNLIVNEKKSIWRGKATLMQEILQWSNVTIPDSFVSLLGNKINNGVPLSTFR